MNCDDFRSARSRRIETQESRAHLAGCPDCRLIDDALTAVGPKLSDPSVWIEPSADLESRVMAAVGGAPAEPAGRYWLSWLAAAGVVALVLGVLFASTRGAGPDWEVTLAATGSAPGAGALASGWREDSGTRVTLAVSGLDPAPEGYVYELWFSNPATRVSAGTFRTAGDVELWTAVSRRDYPRLWVTLQPVGAYDDYVTVLDTVDG